MDTETYEQKQLQHATLEEHKHYLIDNMEMELLSYEGEVLDYSLPITMEFDVVETDNAIAGDTSSGATKVCITQTGLEVRTPLFVKEGDRIRVNTESGEYLTRL